MVKTFTINQNSFRISRHLLNGVFVCLLLVLAGRAIAQERTVTGRVMDAAEGTPLPGVTILVKGD